MGAYKTVGGGVLGALFAIPLFGIFLGIAFFKVSELALPAYIAKLIRTNFLDSPIKFQLNFTHMDPLEIMIKRATASFGEQTEVRDYKDHFKVDDELKQKMEDQSNLF